MRFMIQRRESCHITRFKDGERMAVVQDAEKLCNRKSKKPATYCRTPKLMHAATGDGRTCGRLGPFTPQPSLGISSPPSPWSAMRDRAWHKVVQVLLTEQRPTSRTAVRQQQKGHSRPGRLAVRHPLEDFHGQLRRASRTLTTKQTMVLLW